MTEAVDLRRIYQEFSKWFHNNAIQEVTEEDFRMWLKYAYRQGRMSK
jgi:hypothetical protein